MLVKAKAARVATLTGPTIALLRAALEPASGAPSSSDTGYATTPLATRRSLASPPGTTDALGLGLSSLGLVSPQPQLHSSIVPSPATPPPVASQPTTCKSIDGDPFLHFSISSLIAETPGSATECARVAALSIAASLNEPLQPDPPTTIRTRSLATQVIASITTVITRTCRTPPYLF